MIYLNEKKRIFVILHFLNTFKQKQDIFNTKHKIIFYFITLHNQIDIGNKKKIKNVNLSCFLNKKNINLLRLYEIKCLGVVREKLPFFT